MNSALPYQNSQKFSLYFKLAVLAWILSLATVAGTAGASESAVSVKIVSDEYQLQLPKRSESDSLAERLLLRDSSDLLLDATELAMLSAEIESALAAVRRFDPSMLEITANPRFRLDEMLIKFDGDLETAIVNLLTGDAGEIELNTGWKRFDRLNATLGLFAIERFQHVGIFMFYFDKPVNLPVAIAQYTKINGIRFAETNDMLHHASDVEIVRDHGNSAWLLTFKKPADDLNPPSGITEDFFFRVENGMVEKIQPN